MFLPFLAIPIGVLEHTGILVANMGKALFVQHDGTPEICPASQPVDLIDGLNFPDIINLVRILQGFLAVETDMGFAVWAEDERVSLSYVVLATTPGTRIHGSKIPFFAVPMRQSQLAVDPRTVGKKWIIVGIQDHRIPLARLMIEIQCAD